MPNLGPGNDQHVNPNPIPTWVFTPTPNAPSSVRFYNEGSNVVYVGQLNVTPYNGLPIPPGNRPVEFQNANITLYACSNVTPGTVSNTLTAVALAAGATSFTVGSTTGMAAGTTLILGNTGKGQEVVTVAGTTATAVTVSTGLLYDHAASVTVSTAVVLPGQLRVTAGVV
jgi:hypothetical protein